MRQQGFNVVRLTDAHLPQGTLRLQLKRSPRRLLISAALSGLNQLLEVDPKGLPSSFKQPYLRHTDEGLTLVCEDQRSTLVLIFRSGFNKRKCTG